MKMETKVDVCSANEAGSLYDSSIKKIFTEDLAESPRF